VQKFYQIAAFLQNKGSRAGAFVAGTCCDV